MTKKTVLQRKEANVLLVDDLISEFVMIAYPKLVGIQEIEIYTKKETVNGDD